jgi:transposase
LSPYSQWLSQDILSGRFLHSSSRWSPGPTVAKCGRSAKLATRFEKTARNYLAIITLAAIVLWLR